MKGNNAPPAKAVWRRFTNVELPKLDEVGVVTPWDYPGQEAPSQEQAAAHHTADTVFLTLLDKFETSGREVGDRKGTSYAPALFAEEKEARLPSLAKPTSRRPCSACSMPIASAVRSTAGRIVLPSASSATHRCSEKCVGHDGDSTAGPRVAGRERQGPRAGVDRVSATQPCRLPRQSPVDLYCINKPHSSSTVKSTMTATSATLAIVFMASPYIARRRPKKKPRTGGSGASRVPLGGILQFFFVAWGTRDGEGTAIALNLSRWRK